MQATNPDLLLGEQLRGQFPILQQDVNGRPLVWFDSGATSQKPLVVLDALEAYYKQVTVPICLAQ